MKVVKTLSDWLLAGPVKVLGLFIYDKEMHIPEIQVNIKTMAKEAVDRGEIDDAVVVGVDFSDVEGFSTACYTKIAPILTHYGAYMTAENDYRLVLYLDAHGVPTLITSCRTDWESDENDDSWDGTFSGVYTPIRMFLQVMECLVRTLCPDMKWMNIHLSSCQIVSTVTVVDECGRKSVCQSTCSHNA